MSFSVGFREKRREKRYSPDLTCKILPDSEQMKVLDVSIHGLSIKSNMRIAIGGIVRIRVDLISLGHVDVDVLVRNKTKIRRSIRYGLEICTIPDVWINFVYRLIAESDD